MKTLIILTLFILSIPAMCFADAGGEVFDPYAIFASLGTMVAAILTLTQFIKKMLGTHGKLTMVLSWVVGFVVAAIGWWMQAGILYGVEWFWIFIYGLASGLIANGVASLELIQGILSIFKSKSKQ